MENDDEVLMDFSGISTFSHLYIHYKFKYYIDIGRSLAQDSTPATPETDKYLSDSGLNNVIFGLLEPKVVKSEIDYEEIKYNLHEQDKLYKNLEIANPCNHLQQVFLDKMSQLTKCHN